MHGLHCFHQLFPFVVLQLFLGPHVSVLPHATKYHLLWCRFQHRCFSDCVLNSCTLSEQIVHSKFVSICDGGPNNVDILALQSSAMSAFIVLVWVAGLLGFS